MNHISNRTQLVIFWLLFMVFLFWGTANSKNQGVTSMRKIEGSVWYHERISPPPDAKVIVTLEDVAKMDVKAEKIAETSFTPQGGPPWDFTLEYDPGRIHERGRYAIRARIEVNGQLMFTSTEQISAFDQEPGTPVKILVSMVPRSKNNDTAPSPKPDANLTNTYWKLAELNGEPAALGAGERELHMVLIGGENHVRGFSGCNRFTGDYTIEESQMKFSQMASTSMACMDGMEQEQRFLTALKETDHFEISGEELSLFGSENQMLLRFEAVYLK